MRLCDVNKLKDAFDQEGADICANYGDYGRKWGFSYQLIYDLKDDDFCSRGEQE